MGNSRKIIEVKKIDRREFKSIKVEVGDLNVYGGRGRARSNVFIEQVKGSVKIERVTSRGVMRVRESVS